MTRIAVTASASAKTRRRWWVAACFAISAWSAHPVQGRTGPWDMSAHARAWPIGHTSAADCSASGGRGHAEQHGGDVVVAAAGVCELDEHPCGVLERVLQSERLLDHLIAHHAAEAVGAEEVH